jgi:hypothetical protein
LWLLSLLSWYKDSTSGVFVVRVTVGCCLGFGLSGCALFEELKSVVDELTEPVVMQAIAVGLAEPDPSWGLDLTGTEYEGGSTVQVWISDANTSSGFAPARGARVSFVSDANGSFGLSEEETGYYVVSNIDGLRYSSNDDIDLVSDYAGERQRISMRTPPVADVSVPTDHTPLLGMTIDIRGQGFDNAAVVVFDITTGRAVSVWESDYDKTKPEDSSNLVQSIGGDTFQPNRIFVIGVAGLTASSPGDLHGLQVLGSGMMAGSMVLNLVTTFDSWDTGF